MTSGEASTLTRPSATARAGDRLRASISVSDAQVEDVLIDPELMGLSQSGRGRGVGHVGEWEHPPSRPEVLVLRRLPSRPAPQVPRAAIVGPSDRPSSVSS